MSRSNFNAKEVQGRLEAPQGIRGLPDIGGFEGDTLNYNVGAPVDSVQLVNITTISRLGL